jgi:hypothetical protein
VVCTAGTRCRDNGRPAKTLARSPATRPGRGGPSSTQVPADHKSRRMAHPSQTGAADARHSGWREYRYRERIADPGEAVEPLASDDHDAAPRRVSRLRCCTSGRGCAGIPRTAGLLGMAGPRRRRVDVSNPGPPRRGRCLSGSLRVRWVIQTLLWVIENPPGLNAITEKCGCSNLKPESRDDYRTARAPEALRGGHRCRHTWPALRIA